MARFFLRVSCGMALIMLLIAWPLNAPVLGTVMGLDAAMQAVYQVADDRLCALPDPLRRSQPLARLVCRRTSHRATGSARPSIKCS